MRMLVEVQLDKLTHSIRTKPQWWQKVHESSIVQKWRAEAAEQGVPEALFQVGIKVRQILTTHATTTLCTSTPYAATKYVQLMRKLGCSGMQHSSFCSRLGRDVLTCCTCIDAAAPPLEQPVHP